MSIIADAVQMFQARRFAEARQKCQQVLSAEPNNQQALYLLAEIAVRQGDDKTAVKHFERALKSASPTVPIQLGYGRVLQRLGRSAEAVDVLESAADLQRGWKVLVELGIALVKSGELSRARTVLEEALEQNPNSGIALRNLARISYMDEDFAGFIELAHRTLGVNPNDLPLAVSLVIVHLEQSEPRAALELCDDLLSKHPSLTGAYGFKYIALAEMGEMEAAQELLDFDTLVRRIPARCPRGYSSLAEFNSALVDHVKNSAMRAVKPDRYTTRSGWQTEGGRLFENNKELGAAMDGMIRDSIDEYVEGLPADPGHPMRLTRPPQPELDTWCVVLNTGGHQAPHMHPNGWLSGVYYVRLPDDFNAQKSRDAGCITFGRGKEELHRVDGPRTLTLRPEEGYFFLFPSYFWHNTEPLESSQERICLAFDLSSNVRYAQSP